MFLTYSKRILGVLGVIFLVSLMPGCPNSTTTDGGTDGGVTDNVQPLSCEAGTACIAVGNADVRGCDLLLNNGEDIKDAQVNFNGETIGQFKSRDKRVALSFIMQKDSAVAAGQYAVLVKLPTGVKGLSIAKSNCYDRKGAAVASPDLKLELP